MDPKSIRAQHLRGCQIGVVVDSLSTLRLRAGVLTNIALHVLAVSEKMEPRTFFVPGNCPALFIVRVVYVYTQGKIGCPKLR